MMKRVDTLHTEMDAAAAAAAVNETVLRGCCSLQPWPWCLIDCGDRVVLFQF